MTITYIVTRFLLHEAGFGLQPAEQVCFVTGMPLLPGVIVLSQLVQVPADCAVTHARPSPAGIARAQTLLWALGQDIYAQFHSHPGRGAEATHPSKTDLATARRWEDGSPFLGAVFSSDGHYVRFFNHQQDSVVHVYGERYTQLEPLLFELHDDDLPSTDAQPRVSDGSAGTPPLVEPGADGNG